MNHKRKIAIVMDCMNMGGTEKALISFLKVLDYDKYDITVLIKTPNGKLEHLINTNAKIKYWSEERNSIRQKVQNHIKCFQFGAAILDVYNFYNEKINEKYWEKSIWYAAKNASFIDTDEYELAIAYTNFNAEVAAKTLWSLCAKKKVLWVHGDYSCKKNAIRLFRKEYSAFHRIYCVSEATRKIFCLKYKNVQKTRVMHNFMDIPEIIKGAENGVDLQFRRPALLTVGRLDKVKGQDIIPETVRRLKDKGHNLTWYIIGDGELKLTIEKEIEKYDVGENVILLGAKQNPYPYMRLCDIYVQPSLSEGYCVAVEEAKLLKKVIVVTQIPSFVEQIKNGENGFVAKGVTAAEISECIEVLLEKPSVKQTVITNLEKESFDHGEQLNDLYDLIGDETYENK